MTDAKKTLAIEARVRDFATKQFSKMRGAVERFGRRSGQALRKVSRQLFNVRTAAAAAVAALGTNALANHSARLIEQVDLHGRWAAKLKISSEELSRMTFAAEQTGLSQDMLVEGLKTIQERMDDATRGGTTYQEHFRDLGLEVLDANGKLKNVGDFLPELAAAVQRAARDGRDLTLFFEDIVGGSENMLELLLRQGPDALRAFGQEADRLGITIDQQMVDRARAWEQQWNRLTTVIDSVKLELLNELLPALTDLANRFSEAVAGNRDKILGFLREIGQGFLRLVDLVTDALIDVVEAVENIPVIGRKLIDTDGLKAELATLRNELNSLPVGTGSAGSFNTNSPFGNLGEMLQVASRAQTAETEQRRAEIVARIGEIEATMRNGLAGSLRQLKASAEREFQQLGSAFSGISATGSGATGAGGVPAGFAGAPPFAPPNLLGNAAGVSTGTSFQELQGPPAGPAQFFSQAAVFQQQQGLLDFKRTLLELQEPTRVVQMQLAMITAEQDKLALQAEAWELNKEGSQELRDALVLVDEQLARTIERLEGGFQQGFRQSANEAIKAWTDLEATGNQVGSQLIGGPLSAFENFLSSIALRTGSVKEAFATMAQSILQDLARLASRLAIVASLRGLAGLAGFEIPAGGGGLNLFANARGGIVPGNMGPPMQAFASGGVVNRPTLALFGEGPSRAEAFVPLPDGRTIPVSFGQQSERMFRRMVAGDAQGSQRPVTVNFHLAAVDGVDMQRKILEQRGTIEGIVRNAIKNDGAMRDSVAGVA